MTKAIKAEVLKKGDAQEAKKKASKNKQKVIELKEQLKITREKVEIIEQELSQLEMPALQDVRAQYLPKYQTALKKLGQKLMEAKDCELEVIRVIEEARTMMREIFYIPYVIISPVRRLLIGSDGEREEYWPINLFYVIVEKLELPTLILINKRSQKC